MNQQTTPGEPVHNLCAWLEIAAREFATRPAVTDTRDGTTYTYNELAAYSAAITRELEADGVAPGDRVALLSAAALQMQRLESQDRMRAMTGGGSPLGGAATGGRGGPR